MTIRQHTLLVTILCVFACAQGKAGDKIRWEWVDADRAFITKVKDALRDNPTSAANILQSGEKPRFDLGFGYSLVEESHGKGYVCLVYKILYRGGEIVSFEIVPQMPKEKELIPAYREMYQGAFDVGENGHAKPYFYCLEAASEPLPGSDAVDMSEKMAFFMSPFSGVIYETLGGFLSSRSAHRKVYQEVKHDITPSICLMLLYSKNPATRLTAYEHFLRHRDEYATISAEVEDRMRVVFEEMPGVLTMTDGCLPQVEYERELMNRIREKPE